ncbi:MAG: glycoside hydrolase family 16 protein [Akkermansiaceae bacterium]|nr:glycoside hydrolase family 16 protein [Akkermansiaceae bacterium]
MTQSSLVILTTLCVLLCLSNRSEALPHADIDGWKLVWRDEFNGRKIDITKWSPCDRGGSDWNNTMTKDAKVFGIGHGRLKLRGIVNRNRSKDKSPFLTGGVTSKGKFAFKHGKIVIRARFDSAKGAWPALWLLGEKGGWPGNGEIDLMEHLNHDNKVYQTVHSAYTKKPGGKNPATSKTTAIKQNDFNTYGIEWDEHKLVFTVNGEKTLTYPRIAAKGDEQWPYKQPFYIIMSMQIGGSWVGPADPKQYPAAMEIDWVRVYERK